MYTEGLTSIWEYLYTNYQNQIKTSTKAEIKKYILKCTTCTAINKDIHIILRF